MANHPERDRKLAELAAASERYVTLGGVFCLVACVWLGWPMLLAWAGFAWWMNLFMRSMRGTNHRSH